MRTAYIHGVGVGAQAAGSAMDGLESNPDVMRGAMLRAKGTVIAGLLIAIP